MYFGQTLSRRSYALFNDIVLFDMTYKTNRYSMVFAHFMPFMGLNHHMQLICFGLGLLRDEKVESFLWLFNNLLNAIRSHKLKNIIIN